MKKRILSIVLTLCMVLMFLPVYASAMSINVNLSIVGAAELKLEVESGDSMDNVKEKIKAQTGYPKTDQILKYNGTVLDDIKTLADYNIQKNDTIVLSLAGASIGTTSEGLGYTIYGGKVTITGYNDSRTTVLIPSTIYGTPVTTIGEHAFANCRLLKGITIPSNVSSVGNGAFYSCYELESVTFGTDSKLQSIGESAFQGCENLERINIPSSVTYLGEQAFYWCTNLKSIIIPDNVTVINDRTFTFCNNLESIFLSDIVSTIGTVAIPATTSQIKYSLDTDKGEVKITEINLGTDRTVVDIPAEICSYPVVAVADGLLGNISSHTCVGGQATCQAKATCGICGNEYGELLNHNLENIPAKDATVTETGNKEYWHCKDCGKYFSDENGKSEIIDLAAWKAGEGKVDKLTLKIIEGTGQNITAGKTKELTFRSNADFSDFIRVELDGKTLDAKYYTAKEGSTIITLKADYVASLPAGDHTIGIVSTSGTATTEFTVNAQAASDNDSPKTGDNSNLLLWLALMILSASGTAGAVAYFRKNRTNK